MGCVHATKVEPRNEIVAVTGDEIFSDSEKNLLKSSWRYLADDLTNRGMIIFLKIFERGPEAQELFSFRGIPYDTLAKNQAFRGHASRQYFNLDHYVIFIS